MSPISKINAPCVPHDDKVNATKNVQIAIVHAQIGHIRLNRPQTLNSLTPDMITTLALTLKTWATDDRVSAVLIDSCSPIAFSAGGDLRFFYTAVLNRHHDNALLENFFSSEYKLNHLIHHYRKHYIALMDGAVMGGGMGIAQSGPSSRIRIVTERTKMAMPEVNIGLFPDVGGGYFLSHLEGELGTYLGLTGQTIDAADAVFTDLADFFVPSDELPYLVRTIESVQDGNYREAVAAFTKPFANQSANSELKNQKDVIDRHFRHDNVATIMASLQQDDSSFARTTLHVMQKRSPLMMCVTLQQLRRAKHMGLSDCLRMERAMIHHCFERHEVIEGIRAAIIDKDHQPRWQPASVADVTPDMVSAFFEPAWLEDEHPLRDLRDT